LRGRELYKEGKLHADPRLPPRKGQPLGKVKDSKQSQAPTLPKKELSSKQLTSVHSRPGLRAEEIVTNTAFILF